MPLQEGTPNSNTADTKPDIATAGYLEVVPTVLPLAVPSAEPGSTEETQEDPRQHNRSNNDLPAPFLGAKNLAISPVDGGGEQTSSAATTGAAPVISDDTLSLDTNNAIGEKDVRV